MSEQTKIDDGGPAFPRPVSAELGAADMPSSFQRYVAQPGMTLRAYLAGRAMQGILSAGTVHEDGDDRSFVYGETPHSWNWPDAPRAIARLAAEVADALIAELDKQR